MIFHFSRTFQSLVGLNRIFLLLLFCILRLLIYFFLISTFSISLKNYGNNRTFGIHLELQTERANN